MGSLKALQVKNFREPGRYSDGTAGLHLFIQKSGSKSWVQRIVVDGQRKDIGLGAYPAVSLAQARNLALNNKERVRKGKPVQTARQTSTKGKTTTTKAKAAGPTFSDLAQTYYKRHESSWSENHARVVRTVLNVHALPAFGEKEISAISRKDVTGLLEGLLLDRPAMAQKTRAVLAGVLGDAEAKGLVEMNHAGPVIDRLMKGAGKVKNHQRSLPYSQVGNALAAVDISDSWPIVKLAMRFLALTAARPKEVRLAEWTEIDFENRVWTVPAEKMKARREHRQPLSDAAVRVLETAKEWDTGSGWVFPSHILGGQKPLGKDTLNQTLQLLEIGATAHGFRASSELGYRKNTTPTLRLRRRPLPIRMVAQ